MTLPELLGAFSLAIDLGLGQPMEHVLRSWRVAARLGDAMGLAEDQRDSLFHIAMLSWVGCVADAPEVANWFGDDIAFRADSYDVELASLPGVGFFLGHAGRGGSVPTRVRKVASIVARGGLPVLRGIQSHCAATSLMAARLGLSPEVCTALGQFFTRWDGRGVPFGVRGEEIALTVRLIHLADVVEVRHRSAGVAGAVAVARARRGGQFDPRLVDAFCTMAEEVLPALDDGAEPYDLILAEPSLRLPLTDAALDQALGVVADFTDLRSTSRAGHSSAVATLASDAARILRLGADDVVTLRRAALVHDIGLHGVPASILDKGEPLTRTERELLMMSSYYTHRVLARPPSLARIGAVASLAHERMDGSGHHRGLTGSAIPMTGRVLAAADAYRTLLEPREGRPALSSRQAVDALRSHVRAGRLDADAADAVLV
ncbi:MAG: HD domain-containing protein, partial [Dermatophilaceae bacterium]|nr:HD domain-containing protein [Dermatophilaceae bacterium]